MLPEGSFTELEVRLAERLQVWLAAEQVHTFKELQELILKEHLFSFANSDTLEWVFQTEPPSAWEAARKMDTVLARKNRGKAGKGGSSGVKFFPAASSWKTESPSSGGAAKGWSGEKGSGLGEIFELVTKGRPFQQRLPQPHGILLILFSSTANPLVM